MGCAVKVFSFDSEFGDLSYSPEETNWGGESDCQENYEDLTDHDKSLVLVDLSTTSCPECLFFGGDRPGECYLDVQGFCHFDTEKGEVVGVVKELKRR